MHIYLPVVIMQVISGRGATWGDWGATSEKALEARTEK